MFELGWPKADTLSANIEEASRLKSDLKLQYPISVLYAPSWENHGKQDEFVQALKELPVNLLLKQAPWSDAYSVIRNNISEMNALHRGYRDNVHVIDPNVSIFTCLALSDLIVSDESSVLVEALLLDVPSIAVVDWLIPDCNPPRYTDVPFDFVEKTTRRNLKSTVIRMIDDLELYRFSTLVIRDNIFSYLGESSVKIIDIIDHFIIKSPTNIKKIEPSIELIVPTRKEQLSRMSNKLRIDAMVR
jgi:CDP-glycerol glycerophosphotransferase (TagB/SpsB family)